MKPRYHTSFGLINAGVRPELRLSATAPEELHRPGWAFKQASYWRGNSFHLRCEARGPGLILSSFQGSGWSRKPSGIATATLTRAHACPVPTEGLPSAWPGLPCPSVLFSRTEVTLPLLLGPSLDTRPQLRLCLGPCPSPFPTCFVAGTLVITDTFVPHWLGPLQQQGLASPAIPHPRHLRRTATVQQSLWLRSRLTGGFRSVVDCLLAVPCVGLLSQPRPRGSEAVRGSLVSPQPPSAFGPELGTRRSIPRLNCMESGNACLHLCFFTFFFSKSAFSLASGLR